MSLGIESIAVHSDIAIVESNQLLGNTDPRFSGIDEVVKHRMVLAAAAGCEQLVVMVPQISDQFLDLDQGKIVAPKEGYKNWPEHLRPKTDYVYDPEKPAPIVDLPTDGLVTTRPGKGLMLNAADCAPVALYDPVNRVLAEAHVGREGAIRELGGQMLKYLVKQHQTKPQDVMAYFGSSIAPQSYVLPTLAEPLRQMAWKPFLKQTEGGYETDITGYAIYRLLEQGVQGSNISRSTVDVSQHPDYASLQAFNEHRKPNARNGFIAAIKAQD